MSKLHPYKLVQITINKIQLHYVIKMSFNGEDFSTSNTRASLIQRDLMRKVKKRQLCLQGSGGVVNGVRAKSENRTVEEVK